MVKEKFKDEFSKQAELYSKFRPRYPKELFKYLSSLVQSNDLVWDCASGSGQAAVGIAPYFKKVIASDASAKQIENAISNEKISYKIFPAEKPDLETDSVDLITIAQALHWLKIHRFFTESKRVLKPDGIIAVWFYQLPVISPSIDKVIRKLYNKILGNYWRPERQMIDSGYSGIPFPFQKLYSPKFEMKSRWSYRDLMGYLSTWSAVQRYKTDKRKNPLKLIDKELAKQFRNVENFIEVDWPLTLWIGKNQK
ncbi:class I SAM-dependent methyltransferase [Bacteroidota bacterium]